MAVGAIPIGIITSLPSTVVDWSRRETSRINRGRILNLLAEEHSLKLSLIHLLCNTPGHLVVYKDNMTPYM
jgi:hypothetical protein